jgi:hypothetical protein
MFRQRPKVEVDAVLDDDIDELLDGLNIKPQFYAGEYKCSMCGVIITSENMKMIIPGKDEIKFICDKPSCMVEFAIGA